ncbi:retropepsin-like aspartic protease [Pedobacter sp. AW31-3R]|uniref:retropepsin-like aspartic protease n=1 Tax=Pedobacter sp. AW31-3R TaxID=3445781 RepID=UPI003FA00BD3
MRTIKVPLTLVDLNGDGYHLFVEITAFGKNYIGVVDTGASRTVFDKRFIEENMKNETEEILATSVTLFATTTTIIGVIPKFKIGKLNIKNYPVVALDLDSVNEAYAQHNKERIIAILGSDIFYNYQAKINYKKLTIQFEAKKLFPWE